MPVVEVCSEELPPHALPLMSFNEDSYPVFWLEEDGESVGSSFSGDRRMMLPLVEMTAASRKDLTKRVFLSLVRLGFAAGFPGRATVFVRHSWTFIDPSRPAEATFALMASFSYHVPDGGEDVCLRAGRLMSCSIPSRIPCVHDRDALERVVTAMAVMAT